MRLFFLRLGRDCPFIIFLQNCWNNDAGLVKPMCTVLVVTSPGVIPKLLMLLMDFIFLIGRFVELVVGEKE